MIRIGFKPGGACSAISRHQIALAIVGTQNFDVLGGESGSEQPLGHRVGRDGGAANRIGGIDFDELLKDVVRQLAGCVIQRRGHQRAQKKEDRKTQFVHARCYQRLRPFCPMSLR